MFLSVVSACVFADVGIQQILYAPTHTSSVIGSGKNDQISNNFLVDMGYQLYSYHMLVAMGMPLSGGSLGDVDYIQLIRDLRASSVYNVMDLLQFEQDRAVVMDDYLRLLDGALMKSDVALANLKVDMTMLDGDLDACTAQKKTADSQYMESVNGLFDMQSVSKSLTDSMTYGQCMSDKKIQYNAKNVLVVKITFYRDILLAKYSYLSKNRTMIVEDYDLIKGDLLQKLLDIKKILEKYDY